jgi:hypothetical protein
MNRIYISITLAFVFFQIFIFNISKIVGNSNYINDIDIRCHCISAVLSLKNNHFKTSDTKNVILTIYNFGNQKFKIPEWLVLGRLYDNDSEIIFEIQKKSKIFSKFQDVDYEKSKHYLYLNDHRKEITLRLGTKIDFEENLEFVYQLKKAGEYRVRAIIRLGEFIDCEEFKTEWVSFYIN